MSKLKEEVEEYLADLMLIVGNAILNLEDDVGTTIDISIEGELLDGRILKITCLKSEEEE